MRLKMTIKKMTDHNVSLRTIILTIMLSFCGLSNAFAHIMVAQHGTLNIVDNGVYAVVSLPISAFYQIDKHKSTTEKMVEFNAQRKKITTLIKDKMWLTENAYNHSLKGLRLIPSLDHHGDYQVIVMGRFEIADASNRLEFNLNLFGEKNEENSYKITAKHKLVGWQHSFVIDQGAAVASFASAAN